MSPAELEDEGTYLHGRMEFPQPQVRKLEFLMQFPRSKFSASLCQSDCNCVPRKLLMNEFSKAKTNIQISTYPPLNSKLIKLLKERCITVKASSMLSASSKSLEMKFRPIPPATISD